MISADEELALTRSARYRMAVIGLRLGMIAFPSLIVATALIKLGAPDDPLKNLIKVLMAVGILGTIMGWLGAISLARRTSRITGASAGNIDFERSGRLVVSLLRDVCNFRRWRRF